MAGIHCIVAAILLLALEVTLYTAS